MEFTKLCRDEISTELIKHTGISTRNFPKSKLTKSVNDFGVTIINSSRAEGFLIHTKLECTETRNIHGCG